MPSVGDAKTNKTRTLPTQSVQLRGAADKSHVRIIGIPRLLGQSQGRGRAEGLCAAWGHTGRPDSRGQAVTLGVSRSQPSKDGCVEACSGRWNSLGEDPEAQGLGNWVKVHVALGSRRDAEV